MLRELSEGATRLSHRLAHLEIQACQFLIVGFAGLLLVNVLMRYLLNAPLYFAEELAIYTLIWMAFLAIAATIARRNMIALTFLADQARPAMRLFLHVIVEALILAMCLILAWVSWHWLNSGAVAYEQALTLGMVKWPFYVIVPLFFSLATLHSAVNLLHFLPGGPAAKSLAASGGMS